MSPTSDPTKELRLLFAFFGDAELPKAEFVSPEDIPSPYHELLVHHGHMTEALEKHFGKSVAVHPYLVHRQGEMYGRKLDLSLAGTDQIVMTGLMIINLTFVSNEVARLITEAKIPLGRVLIDHNILRKVNTGSYLKFEATDPLVARFHAKRSSASSAHVGSGTPSLAPTYGRLATIFFDGKPAVDLLEIVAP